MKAAIVALSAMIGMTACNREDREGGKSGAEDSLTTGEKVSKGMEEAGQEIGEATDKAVAKTEEETRQATRDVKEGAGKLAEKTEEEAGKLADKTQEGAGSAAGKSKAQPGDEARTQRDQQLLVRIRRALASDRQVASEARDVRVEVDQGNVDLEGTVTSKPVKDRISRIVNGIAGEINVDDDLKVAEQVGAGPSDR